MTGWLQTSAKQDINIDEAISVLLRQVRVSSLHYSGGRDKNLPFGQNHLFLIKYL